MQLPDCVEPTHPEFARESVKTMKAQLSLALTHLQQAKVAANSDSTLKPYAERMQRLLDQAAALRRDLDHVV